MQRKEKSFVMDDYYSLEGQDLCYAHPELAHINNLLGNISLFPWSFYPERKDLPRQRCHVSHKTSIQYYVNISDVLKL
jgi:hypothetical protein